MNIRTLSYIHSRLSVVKAWYFLVPAIIFLILAVVGLRHNYATMVTLREEVYKADQQNGDVETALQNLRRQVYGHMNTNLSSGNNSIKPPIQLKARYDRLVAAEKDSTKNRNEQIAAEGERICGAQFPQAGYNAPRVACIQQYVSDHAVTDGAVPDQLYKFDFVSPKWSPDLAGYSILLFILFFVLFITRLLLERYMRKRLE